MAPRIIDTLYFATKYRVSVLEWCVPNSNNEKKKKKKKKKFHNFNQSPTFVRAKIFINAL